MRTPKLTDRRGMALAVAIFALVVVGALVAGAFFAGHLEQRTGRNTVYAAQATDAAEAGLANVSGNWDGLNLGAVAINDSSVMNSAALGATGSASRTSYKATMIRVADGLYLIKSLGTLKDAGGNILSQRLVATMARKVIADVSIKAAVTVGKPVTFNGNTFEVDGRDEKPSTWGAEVTNCSTSSDLAGIRSATTSGAAGKDTTHIFGSPKQIQNDASVNTDFSALFGSTFDALKKMADITLSSASPYTTVAPTTTGNPKKCDASNILNWGEPNHQIGQKVVECYSYFPIVYSTSTLLKLAGGGRGQGILLIEGDFEAAGGFEFTGLIIAKGGIKITGNGNKITGALMARDISIDDQNSISGNTLLQYSSCAVAKALAESAQVLPFRQRSWAQLY
jgi:hypothetical protein